MLGIVDVDLGQCAGSKGGDRAGAKRVKVPSKTRTGNRTVSLAGIPRAIAHELRLAGLHIDAQLSIIGLGKIGFGCPLPPPSHCGQTLPGPD